MKNAIAGIAVLLVTGAAPVFAQDGRVADSTLSALGLGGMQVVSDAEGMQVRGMSASATSMGSSLIFGQIIEPNTKSFVAGSDVNMAFSSVSAGWKSKDIKATHIQDSSLLLRLNIEAKSQFEFEATLFGGAGGYGMAPFTP